MRSLGFRMQIVQSLDRRRGITPDLAPMMKFTLETREATAGHAIGVEESARMAGTRLAVSLQWEMFF